MRWKIELEPEYGWIVTTYLGRLTRQDCVRSTREALDRGSHDAPQGYIVDVREASCELGAGDIYAVPAMWVHAGVHRGSALAMLIHASTTNRRDTEFFENTCRNRGWNVRVFEESDAARDWLARQVSTGDAAVNA